MILRLALLLLLISMPSVSFGQALPPIYTGIAAPVNTVAPEITGDTAAGSTLTVTPGTYSNNPIEVRGQWTVDGSPVSGETGSTFDTTGLDAGDVVTFPESALNAAGSVTTVSNSIVLTGDGNANIESATINSAGTTLTVVLDSSDTITDETGWSITFDNDAERVLNYASGTGTDTFVFDIGADPDYTAEGTDNDAAPVGTVALLTYDADTGNVGSLEDVGGYSVTNNSTVIPEPDLPGNLPDATLPTGWDGTADYTPADFAALQELVDGDASGDATNGTAEDYTIIELDGTYTGGLLTIDDSCDYIVFRTAAFTSLPAHGTRLTPAHEEHLAVVTRVGTSQSHSIMSIPAGSGAPGASHLRFVGIQFEVTGSFTDIVSIVFIGGLNGTTDTTTCPINIGFNHCWVTASDTTENREGVRLDAIDSYFVDGRITNLDGGGEDGSLGLRSYLCRGIVWHNNYVQTESAAFFLGGNETNRCDDVLISNNYSTRDAAWNDGNGQRKAGLLEVKTCQRLLVENNTADEGYWSSGSVHAFQIKAGEPSGPVVNKWSRHVTIRSNVMSDFTGALIFHETGSSGTGQGPCLDLLFENNAVLGTSGNWSITITPAGGNVETLDRVKLLHNSIDKIIYNGLEADGRFFICKDNIATSFGANGLGNGAVALNTNWGSTYDVQYNAFVGENINNYDNDTSPTPTGTLDNNLFPADSSTLGYSTYPPTELSHLAITGGVCNNAGSDGTDIGADIAELVTIMSGVVE